MGRGEDEFWTRVFGGEDPSFGHGERWGDGDPTAHAGFDHVQTDHGAERIAGHPRLVVGDGREEVDGRGNIESFGVSVVVFATAGPDATEVEAETVEAEIGEMVEQGLHDRVEAVAPVERMRMGDCHRAPDIGGRRSEVGCQLDSVDGRECHRAVGHGTTVP